MLARWDAYRRRGVRSTHSSYGGLYSYIPAAFIALAESPDSHQPVDVSKANTRGGWTHSPIRFDVLCLVKRPTRLIDCRLVGVCVPLL